jgi:hypothetical protein
VLLPHDLDVLRVGLGGWCPCVLRCVIVLAI